MATNGMARTRATQATRLRSRTSSATTPLWRALTLPTAVAVLMIVSLPTFLVLLFGMLPSLVALIIDRSEGKYAALCVGGLNFAGVFPFLLHMWHGSPSFHAARLLLTDVFVLSAMYGAAAFGWLLFLGLPSVMSAVSQAFAQHRVGLLRARQQHLIDEWGEDVRHPLQSAQSQQSPRSQKSSARS